jgi:hypothetical protein
MHDNFIMGKADLVAFDEYVQSVKKLH